MGETLEGSLAREFVFFVDRTFGSKKLPRLLRQAGLRIRVHDEEYRGKRSLEVGDDEWMALCGSNGWIALTEDREIGHRLAQRARVKRTGIKLFAFRTANKRAEEVAAILLKAVPRILEIAEKYDGPLIGGVVGYWPWATLLHTFKNTRQRP